MERKNVKSYEDNLSYLLHKSWSAETAAGEWSQENPSLNQCAVTALVVQDLFGGDLLRCEMTNGNSHYWNRLPDGTELDLSKEQFEFIQAQPKRETVVIRERQYVLSFPNTIHRYGILLQNLAKAIISTQ